MRLDRARAGACALLVAVMVLLAAPAAAAAAPDEFSMVYFPHPDVSVEFGNDFGSGRSGGRSHQGIDIFSEKMTPVVAVADGFVETLGSGPRSGRYVRLRHGNGWESWYLHINNDTPGTDDGRGGEDVVFGPGIVEGAFVLAGQVVAWVGDSGNAEGTRPHTHFELHHDDRVVNPYRYLDEAWERQRRIWELAGDVR